MPETPGAPVRRRDVMTVRHMKLGIDIGSVAAKAVVAGDDGYIAASWYRRTSGQPVETVLDILSELFVRYAPDRFEAAAATGSGGKHVAGLLEIPFVNEIIAQAAGTARYHPEAKAVFEMGGADTKLIILGRETPKAPPVVTDFTMSGDCAAGTGAFLDQQAARLGIPIARLGDIALESAHPARIAGRCSVFAKTDMIHLQQVGTPVPDIVAGLCLAMARQFQSNIIRGRDLDTPVAFQGGVAANRGIREAVVEVLHLGEGELIVPVHHAVLGALGAVLTADAAPLPHDSAARLRHSLERREYRFVSLPPLHGDGYPLFTEPVSLEDTSRTGAYVGVDVGSISTNVVVIDADGNVLARRYLMTTGQPIEAVKKGLYEIGQELGDRVAVRGAGSTGSGRYLTGAFVGADIVRNEITSHARGSTLMCPEADTIFEIGGQDAKYISLNHGTIVDFSMNKVCAAGTGSFLEEQSGNLDINISEEFADLALSAARPLDLGERCTVFMESQLNFYQQRGAGKKELVSGLAYSIVKNYLTKVVESRRVGDRILFQGGVAYNRAVKAAFEAVLGKQVEVPPHHDVLGAVGVAILARDAMEASGGRSRFLGFDLRDRGYQLSTFECQDCTNHCEIHRIVFEDDAPLHYGSRCGKYDAPEKKEKKRSSKLPRLFDERRKALLNTYARSAPENPDARTVGIRLLHGTRISGGGLRPHQPRYHPPGRGERRRGAMPADKGRLRSRAERAGERAGLPFPAGTEHHGKNERRVQQLVELPADPGPALHPGQLDANTESAGFSGGQADQDAPAGNACRPGPPAAGQGFR